MLYYYSYDNQYRAIVVLKSKLPYIEVWKGLVPDYDVIEIDSTLMLYSNINTLDADKDDKRLLQAARNYKIHSLTYFMNYTQLNFIMNKELPSQLKLISQIEARS